MTKPRILIVDDEPMNRCLLETILASEGYDVVEACDGVECLEHVQSTEVDLVLLDVMMPRMTGFEACVRIRNDLGRHDLPIIFVTALGDREARIHGKDVGADEFLTKPIDDVELLVRVRSLLRIKAQHDAREKQRRLMSAILDAMTEGVVATDAATGFTVWNPAAERILGPRETWQQPASWQGEAAGEPLARALAGEATTERRVQHGGIQLSVNARPLITDRGAASAVAVFRDVTELVALDQFKHEMTSLVVHDLKNVMQVIEGNVELALDEVGPANAELDAMLQDAKDAASRALRLIANLMDVSRLENRAFPLNLGALDVDAQCRLATRHRAAQLRAKQIALQIRSEVAVCAAGDAEVVQRVLDNLLDNAVRYTPCGGRIVLSMTSTDDRIRIAIGNTGTPIPIEHQRRIFEKYGRSTQPSRSGLNAGLGLYFCRLAVAAHGGSIWVESTPELPTVFVIELPITPAKVEAA